MDQWHIKGIGSLVKGAQLNSRLIYFVCFKMDTVGYNIKPQWNMDQQESKNRHDHGCPLSGQLCFTASQHLTSVLCCCNVHARLSRKQLTIVIKSLSKQTQVWLVESNGHRNTSYTNTLSACCQP